MSVPIYLEAVRVYYQDYLPNRAAALSDPEAHYRQLAEQISEQVAQVSAQIEAKTAEPGEDYLTRFGKLNTARAQAEELALHDLLYSIPPETDEDVPASSRDQSLLVMREEENAIAQRLQMEERTPEAHSWDQRYPHLVEEVRWLQSDHEGVTEQQKKEQLERILAVQDAARPPRQT